MKLPLLLTQFLYKNKKLNLPGIGTFTLDPAAIIPDESNKDSHVQAMGIEFKQAPGLQADNELIEYIRQNTGKIRPLAISDLESYLTLGNELLNIGKPFYLEGIGTLTKGQNGVLHFTPGEYSTTRLEDLNDKSEKTSRKKQAIEETHYDQEVQPASSRKLLLGLAVIGGLVAIGWGGYLFYQHNAKQQEQEKAARVDTVTAAITDSVKLAKVAADSLEAAKAALANAENGPYKYKFILLQTHNKERALKRYNQLLEYQLKINMETKDSSYFKVYFSFPALAKDTIHIKDSLRREYAHDIIIEK